MEVSDQELVEHNSQKEEKIRKDQEDKAGNLAIE